MRMTRAVIVALLLVAFLGGSFVLAREPDSYASKVEAQDLFLKDFAGDPTKEVKSQLYTFPPGAVLPWHIHPDAHEIAYVIEGTFSFERAGEAAEGDERGRGRLRRAERRASRDESVQCAGEIVRRTHQAQGRPSSTRGART
jgi:hypothetical protein